jgi:L-fucose isomerase-like protein
MTRAGYDKFGESFPGLSWEEEAAEPDLILFLGGGSEQDAIARLRPGRFALLLAAFQDNAWAAALEVKAWADNHGVPAGLLSMDEALRGPVLKNHARVCDGFRRLEGKRAGLIGHVSHWLVASSVTPGLLQERLGIELVQLDWEDLSDYHAYPPSDKLLQAFQPHTSLPLEKEAGVYSFLRQVMRQHRLDALTLECFEMVKDKGVTACLALSLLNSEGVVAGCEGDLASLAGLMAGQALTGRIPWMANVAGMNGNRLLLAHCTAPLDLLCGVHVRTHFETELSAAVQGTLAMEELTLFRLDERLERVFIAPGRVGGRPQHERACRTQLEVVLDPADADKLRQSPLGNHHLVLPGNHADLLRMACLNKQIQPV